MKSLSWRGYKKIRSQLLSALSGEIGDALRDVVHACDKLAAAGEPVTMVSVATASGILARVPALLVDIEMRLEDLAMDLVLACCPNVEIDELSPLDVITLRSAVLHHIDLGGLLDAEKNLLGGIATSVMQVINGGTKTDVTDATDATPKTTTTATATAEVASPNPIGSQQTTTSSDAGGPVGNP